MFKFAPENMGDLGEITEPFLAHRAEDELWDRVEQGPSAQDTGPEVRSVRDLVRDNPNEVVRTLEKSGVKKLGTFTVPVSSLSFSSAAFVLLVHLYYGEILYMLDLKQNVFKINLHCI